MPSKSKKPGDNATTPKYKQHSSNFADGTAHQQSVTEKYSALLHAAKRPLPTETGDGSYVVSEKKTGLMQDLKALSLYDFKTLRGLVKGKLSGKPQDDRTYLMERVIQLVSGLPPKSALRVNLTNNFLDELWNNLQHPPLSYFGDQFKYRSGDGSGNNPFMPKLGAANQPYARSVEPNTLQPGALPDPGLIFDSLFARQTFKPHPNGVSSIFFDWASLIIHDLFQTNHRDFGLSQTSSYLDLSILYGDVQEEQDMIRTFKDGKIKPDCFSEARLLAFPPACGVMLIMLNRFHNYVVEQLAAINEGGRFTRPREGLPVEQAKAAWIKHDNDLFQTARLIVCGLYINITLYDYLRTIVNLNRSNTTWCLDPRVDMGKQSGKEGTPRGTGNSVSAEFSLCYRWHSCISAEDEAWTEDIYRELFGKKADDVSFHELLMGLGKWEHALDPDPVKRDFAHLKRGADGKFDDGELVAIMTKATESVAGSFGAGNVPKALRAVEILGMEQARKWNLASLNEFRLFFGLKKYETFEEINPDPYVAEQLRNLYEHPDHVEMYPGIVCEEAKTPMVPGVGIAPTYTISRAVLSDAVALVRGDRYYTIDYNAKNLTSWGISEVAYDLNVNQGCVFYKLMLRSFPNHVKPDSIYAHYPMTVPAENQKIMNNLGRAKHYSWDKPAFIPPRINLTSYESAQYILNNAKDFNVTWGAATGYLFGKGGLDFMLSGDSSFHTKQRQAMGECLYRDKWQQDVKDFYIGMTKKLITEKTCKVAGINQVDITRDVGNLAHVHFASNVFALPLKTADNPHGVYSEHEMFMAVSVIFTCIFFDFDPAKTFPLRQIAYEVSQQLGKLIEANVKSVADTGIIASFLDKFRANKGPLNQYGVHMIRKLLQTGIEAKEAAWSQVLPVAVAMIPNQAQVFSQIIDYYLSDEGKQHLPDIHKLALVDTPETDQKLLRYAMEGIRLNGTFGSYREAAVAATVNDGGREVDIKPGDKVFVSFVGAARDPNIFPSPNEVRLNRPLESYIHYGVGPHTCLGKEASMTALTAMLRVVGSLRNLRRAPGPQGQLKKVARPGGFYVYMREDWSGYFVFPLTMKVHYDDAATNALNGLNGVSHNRK